MSVPTLTELFTVKTREEVMAVQLQVADAVGLPITAWQAGSTGRELLEIAAQSAANMSEAATPAAAAGLLDYAEDDWLTLTAFQDYEVTRVPSTFGSTEETLRNTSVNSYTLAAGEVRLYNISTGKTYTSTTGGTLGPGNVTASTLVLTIVADEPGTGSNAAIAKITGFVTPLTGVTATNADPLVGTDEETDAALRIRCRESTAKASPNGPADAYNYFAKSTVRSDKTSVGVTRTALSQGNGTTFLYLADASGPIAAADVTLVNTNIQANCVPTGFTAVVANATAVTVNVTTTVYLMAGTTATIAEVREAVEDKLTTYFALAPIGGYQAGGGFIFTSAIIGQIFDALPGQIIKVVLTGPAADVALDINKVAVLGTISITIGV